MPGRVVERTGGRIHPVYMEYGKGVPADGPRVCPKCGQPFGPVCMWRLISCPDLGFAMRLHVALDCQRARTLPAAVLAQLMEA